MFMNDHERVKNDKFRLYMNGLVIKKVENYKYLGTEIDSRLSGEQQYTKLVKTLGYTPGTFGKIRRFLTNRAVLAVYRSTILPIIDCNDYYQLHWNKDKLDHLQDDPH